MARALPRAVGRPLRLAALPRALAAVPQAPQPTKNLQVLPKEYTVQQVVPIMQGVAQALGVGCEHCHNFIAPGNPMNDFAADDKPEKNKGRVMMRMVTNINQTLVAQVGKPAADLVQVTCVTCHRGVPVPKQLVDVVVDLGNQAQGGGTAAAIAKYRDLRKQFYGSQAYDFSDFTLFTAAQRANAANKPDDAIAVRAGESGVQPDIRAELPGDVAGVHAQDGHDERHRDDGKGGRGRPDEHAVPEPAQSAQEPQRGPRRRGRWRWRGRWRGPGRRSGTADSREFTIRN